MELTGGSIDCNKTIVLSTRKCHYKWIVLAGNRPILKDEENNHGGDRNSSKDEIEKKLYLTGGNLEIHSLGLNPKFLQSNVVEIYLDNVLSERTSNISLELFKCANMQVLSLRKNNLVRLPADIGRLSKLRTLILTENFLMVPSIPYTLTFCKYLRTLHLDHNFLDALPGFLLEMPHLETVYRHGNHNYFKSTFMLYHSTNRDRILPLGNQPLKKSQGVLYQPETLECYCIKSVISSKANFFKPGLLPATLQEHISQIFMKYRICAYCSQTFHEGNGGYKVFTFKSPYLGNTCVPFEHWTCSRECAVALEGPAHRQERDYAQEADRQYQQYISSVQHDFFLKLPKNKRSVSCSIM